MDNEQSIDEIELNTEVDQESVAEVVESVPLQAEELTDEGVTDDGDDSDSEGIVLDDEDILKERGIGNFDHYMLNPGAKPFLDFYLDEWRLGND